MKIDQVQHKGVHGKIEISHLKGFYALLFQTQQITHKGSLHMNHEHHLSNNGLIFFESLFSNQ